MSKLTITLDDDPTIYVDDQDLSALSSYTVLNQNYKAVQGHLVRLDFSNIPATDYDPQGEVDKIQAQIDELQAKLVPLQAVSAKLDAAKAALS